MEATFLILSLFYLLSISINRGAHGINIQAFQHKNFTGLAWESHSTGDCTNIPRNKYTTVFSIRTDTCFIAYNHPDCKSYFSQKYKRGDIVLSFGDVIGIESFQVCNEEEGGSQLNLDITKYYEYGFVPDVLESYKNVCSCVNVPQHVQNMSLWSINNHHNALLAYWERDCSENKWKSILIAAGHNTYSRHVHVYLRTDRVTNTTFEYQSFGPDRNSIYFQTSCNFSHVTTTRSPKTLENSTESGMSLNSVYERRFQLLTNQILGLQANQLEIHKEQTAYFANLTQSFTELKQGFLDFTAKLKSDLHDLFA